MSFLDYLVSSLFVYCLLGVQENCSQSFIEDAEQFNQLEGDCGFRCGNSSECIKTDQICDGKVDCLDGSDESNSCKRIRCPPYLFVCDYGACVNKDRLCDGKKDCRDGSDEAEVNCHGHNVDDDRCIISEFQCDDGTCINEDGKCDGKYDCVDESDENEQTCRRMICPPYVRRCRYGACINKKKICNGIVDCVDGSDEVGCNNTSTGPFVPSTSTPPGPVVGPEHDTDCPLPDHPKHGKLVMAALPDYLLRPGDYVMEGTALKAECNKGFIYHGDTFIVCLGGEWSRPVGKCLKMCPPLGNTTKMTVSCTRDFVPVSCEEPVRNTVARFRCEPHYVDSSLTDFPTRFCDGNDWTANLPNCAAECGIKNVKSRPLIIGGTEAAKGDYPWQVALYELIKGEQVLICGGSLVNQKVILTAAHCVTNSRNGAVQPKDKYTVAVGKYFRDFNHVNDTEAQFSKVKEIFVAENYRGIEFKYLADVALLIAEKTFKLSDYVLPICIDWGENPERKLNRTGAVGIVTGWGYTVGGDKPSNILKEIGVPYIAKNDCRTLLPTDYKRFLTSDKLCSGYVNESIGVCDGDSGGPLVFRKDGGDKFFIRGIVSLSLKENEVCNVNTYALYTDVSHYLNFISEHEAVYQAL